MSWRQTWIALSALVVAACQQDAKPAPGAASAESSAASSAAARPASLPKLTDSLPSSVTASRPDAKSGDDPKADYQKLDEVYKAQTDAIGKTYLFRGYGTPLGPALAHLSECKPTTERSNTLEATFPASLRDLMRAMPSSQFVEQGGCPRVHVRVTGFHQAHRYPQGEVVEIYDLRPDPPPTNLPAGVDFVSIDDAFLAGPAAVGKVADFGIYVGPRDDAAGSVVLFATGCSPHGGWEAQLFVAEDDANRPFIEALRAAGPSTCARVRAKITAAPTAHFLTRLGAELVGVGDHYRKPHPPPNP